MENYMATKNKNKITTSDIPLLDSEIDVLIQNLSPTEITQLLKSYAHKLIELNQDLDKWKFMACCDEMTTSRLNNNNKAYSECSAKIYTRSYWEAIFKDSNQDLEADCYLIDLNGLKTINDNLGHSKGDNLICECARILSNYGTVFRMGGDEFFLIVDSGREEDFKSYLDTNQDKLTFAYGYYHKLPTDTYKYVLKHTDNKMYNHKRIIKNR